MSRNRIEAGISPIDLSSIRFTKPERQSLNKLASSQRLVDRRRTVDYLRCGQYSAQNKRFILEMCDRLIPDRSHYVRWQSLLIIGRFAETQPEEIWPLVIKWGSVTNKDIRVGIACCVLEHILQHHFREYFPKVKASIEQGNRRMAFTLSCCWFLGEAAKPENKKMFEELLSHSRWLNFSPSYPEWPN